MINKHAIKYLQQLFTLFCLLLFVQAVHAQSKIVLNVTSFGANGADTLDDTKAIQACIDAATLKNEAIVYFPKGTYFIYHQKIPGKSICLLAKSNVSFQGEDKNNCVLKLANNQPGFSSVISILKAGNISIKNLTVDGNYLNQHVFDNEHSHGILIDQSNKIDIDNCALINTPGDGLSIRGITTTSSDINITNCFFNGNQRHALVLGSGFNNITIKNCFFGQEIVNDAIHTEPERGSFFGNVLIENNNIETPHTLSIAGSSADTMATNFIVRNNKLRNCSIYMVYASNVTLQNNQVESSLKKPAVTIFKKCRDIVISNNQFTVDHNSAFTIAYAANLYATNIKIDSNVIYFNEVNAPCFQIKGCDSIRISHNKIVSGGNSKILLEVNATRPVNKLDFSYNEADYFARNFNIKYIKDYTINNFSASNNKLSNKSFSIDKNVQGKMKNTLLQNNH